MAERSNASDY